MAQKGLPFPITARGHVNFKQSLTGIEGAYSGDPVISLQEKTDIADLPSQNTYLHFPHFQRPWVRFHPQILKNQRKYGQYSVRVLC